MNEVNIATRKLPGTSYSVELKPHPTSNNGKISLIKGKWPVGEKICPALDSRTIISILEDIIEAEGFALNPRILSRVVGELLEEISEAPKTPAVTKEPSLFEMEEEVPLVTTTVQPSAELTITPPVNEAPAPVQPTPLTPPTPTSPIGSTLPEETSEHLQVLKTQIKELQTLVKTISEKFDALNIIVEKLERQTD
ncbi:MAG: hypothetical protein ACFFCD_08335 [Promethearchaeota archaeon]